MSAMSGACNTSLAARYPCYDDQGIDNCLCILIQSQAVSAMTHMHHASTLRPCCKPVCSCLCFVWHCKLSARGFKSVILDSLFALSIDLGNGVHCLIE